ncbi:MAG TPA: biopolymer transporter ExbD [Candidatus Omnitrophota bacterium]|nr:biopolymer transporter ExbD [Candidatus Omnitrophota bacterium]
MKIPAYQRKRARIEIIPLIDIVFFLLATFVMVSLSMVKNQAVPVHLPVAETAVAQDRKSFTTLTVTEEGFLYINKDKINLDSLPARLKQIQAEDKDPKIFIHGDQKANFGSAIRVLDEVRKTGISKVAIQTTSDSQAAASAEKAAEV